MVSTAKMNVTASFILSEHSDAINSFKEYIIKMLPVKYFILKPNLLSSFRFPVSQWLAMSY